MTNELPLLTQIVAFAGQRGISLPVFSDTAMKLRTAASQGTYNVQDIERAIASDQMLTAGVLRAANSAFFGGLAQVTTIRSAIVRLGLDQVSRLVVLASEESRYTARNPQLALLMKDMWQHASACALASDWVARRMRYTSLSEEAFIGGLLHDIGKLFIVRVLDEMAQEAPGKAVSLDLVHEVLRTAHTEQGHQLLIAWNLPEIYRTIVRDHHVEPLDGANVVLAIVRLADIACNKVGVGLRADASLVLAATAEAIALGMTEVSLAELEIVLEDTQAAAVAAA